LVTMMESFEWLRVFESLPGAGAEEVERRRVERRREFEVEMDEFEERWGRGAKGTKATGTKAQREFQDLSLTGLGLVPLPAKGKGQARKSL
jgi:hypothetical protein